MRIEVATHPSAPTKTKGDLLVTLAEQVLQRQQYAVRNQVRRTASELDLDCEHKVSHRTLYVECKAHREPLSANVLTNLLGNLHFHEYDEAWLISTGPLGKDAKGFQHDWDKKSPTETKRLSIYTPDRIIDLLLASGFIAPAPVQMATATTGNSDRLGEWTLLVTEYGIYWAVVILESRVPAGALVFDAKVGTLLTDAHLLRQIAGLDSTVSELSLDKARFLLPQTNDGSTETRTHRVVQVQSGVDWKDYRPARPEHFVGRKEAQDRVLSLLDAVREGTTKTRVFAVTGDSGMGKSSLIAKLRDRCANVRHRSRFYMFAVDVRAATEPGYINAAILAALNEAAQSGFGSHDPEPLRITDHADPLSSPSVAKYLESLEAKQEIVCLVFDQFEELYSKPELFQVFEESQRLFLAATSACTSLALGFAWKTDSTVQQGHPAYFMWHRLADHRFEVSLYPFTHPEASAALTLFEKEIGTQIRPELRRQVIEISQGLPWLIKKLCVHIWENIQSGISQEELADTLEVSTLFDRDLQVLSKAENGCLKAIAKGSPADWYEILEIYGEEVLRSLQQRRLVVRSGDRLNLYWDIFRDYVTSGTVPSLPFTYLPSSPSLKALLKVSALLDHETPQTIDEIVRQTAISEGTAQNIIHDLIMFGVATGEPRRLSLDERCESGETRQVLQRLREVLRRHALTLRLSQFEKTDVITQEEVINQLRTINRAAQHRARTWRLYADRISRWLHATGLLVPVAGDWRFQDRGEVHVPKDRRSRVGKFLGDAPPEKVVTALR